jgi:lysylphosphatidylglycerol synthetase-like protein (DUF2156 family)
MDSFFLSFINGGLKLLKNFLLINTLLILFYHAGVIFAAIMQMGNMTSNEEIISNLYWIIPQSFVLASIPNIVIYLLYKFRGGATNLVRNFWIAEIYVVLIYLILHGGIIFILS